MAFELTPKARKIIDDRKIELESVGFHHSDTRRMLKSEFGENVIGVYWGTKVIRLKQKWIK